MINLKLQQIRQQASVVQPLGFEWASSRFVPSCAAVLSVIIFAHLDWGLPSGGKAGRPC
jgi:hypothetical protein